MTTSESPIRPVTLVTGSTDGLGRAVARSLAASGFRVLIHRYPLDFDNLMLTRAYSGMRAYPQARRRLAEVSARLAGLDHPES